MPIGNTSKEYSTTVEVYETPTLVDSTDDMSNTSEQPTTPFVRLPFSTLEKYIDAIVEHKLQYLLNKPKVVNDEIATNEIKNFIQQQKQIGIQLLDVFEIATALNLPVLQVEKIADDYVKKGYLKELDE